MLLADLIARKPDEVVPVVALEFHFGLVFLTVAIPDATTVPIDAARNDVADLAVVDALDGFHVAGFMAALQTDTNHQVLLLGFLDGGQHAADTGSVGGDGLLHEDVLVLRDGILKLLGTESRRRGDDDQVAIAVDGFLVSVQAAEDIVFRNSHLIGVTIGQVPDGAAGLVLEKRRRLRPA